MHDPFPSRGTLQFVCSCSCVQQQILLANDATTAITSFFLLQDAHRPLQSTPCIFPLVARSPDSSWLSWCVPISALFFLSSDPKPCMFSSSVGSLTVFSSQPGFVLTPGPINHCGPGVLRSLCYTPPAPSLQLPLASVLLLLPYAFHRTAVAHISSQTFRLTPHLTSPRWLITPGDSPDCGFHPAALQRAMAVSRDTEGQPVLPASRTPSTSFDLN